MRQRKTHAVTAVGGDAQPARLVAVSADVECHGAPGEVGWQEETLTRWAGSGWQRSKEGVYTTWNCSYHTAEAWWRSWTWAAKRPGVTWIVAHRMVRFASLLGLWSQIDGGAIQFDGRQEADPRPGRDGRDLRQVRGTDGPADVGRHTRTRRGVSAVPPLLPPGGSADGEAPRHPQCASASVVIEDPPTIIRLRVPGRPGRIWLLDSRNWGVEPDAGQRTAAEEARWLAGVMRRMVDELHARGWGGLKATAGSQSLYTWRRTYMTHSVVAHGDDDALAIEGAAYYGGRCECARLGRIAGPLYMVDRRSAYAHACATVDVPLGIERRIDGDLHSMLDSPVLACRCAAEVELASAEPAYPRGRGGCTTYPVGRIATTLAGPELADAVRRRRLRRVGRAVLYHAGPALRAYAGALWDARCDWKRTGDAELSTWAKLMLVGLPGKLGQRLADWEPAPHVLPPAPWHCWWGVTREREVYKLRALGGMTHRQHKAGWTYDAVPAVAAWILSAARVELLRAIRVAGWSHCLYWDTDSLLLDRQGYDALLASPGMCGEGLGQWRLVREVALADQRGVKHYQHDGDTTCAGMPRGDSAATRLKDRYWYREKFGRALLDGHAPGARRRLLPYVRARPYSLGRVGDGGVVYPFVADDWHEEES